METQTRQISIPRIEKLARAYNSNPKLKGRIDNALNYAFRYPRNVSLAPSFGMVSALARHYLEKTKGSDYELDESLGKLEGTANRSGIPEYKDYTNSLIDARIEELATKGKYSCAAHYSEGRGDILRAESLHHKNLDRALALGDSSQIGWAYQSLLEFSLRQGQPEKAKGYYARIYDLTKKDLEAMQYQLLWGDAERKADYLRHLAKEVGIGAEGIDELFSKVRITNQKEVDEVNRREKLKDEYFSTLVLAAFTPNEQHKEIFSNELLRIADELNAGGK